MTADGSSAIPGPDGTPLPAGRSVLRLGPQPPLKNLNDPGHASLRAGKAWPGLFLFSSREKAAEAEGARLRLSVWAERLTTLSQAWLLVGGNPNNRIALTIPVDSIRNISAAAMPGGVAATPYLDVVWERAVRRAPDGSGDVPDDRPGSEGHCGIDGLRNGTPTQQKRLLQLLADAVPSGGLVELTEEQITAFRSISLT